MSEFVNPFSGKVPDRKLTMEELIRAIRLDLSSEQEAVHLFTAHAEATDNPLAKKVFIDIANEERVHIGELPGCSLFLRETKMSSWQKAPRRSMIRLKSFPFRLKTK